MPNALTLETMSPGLLKVGGTRNPEPHRRKSRMREIRSSGSGEGLGWATSQPTLQRTFATTVWTTQSEGTVARGCVPRVSSVSSGNILLAY